MRTVRYRTLSGHRSMFDKVHCLFAGWLRRSFAARRSLFRIEVSPPSAHAYTVCTFQAGFLQRMVTHRFAPITAQTVSFRTSVAQPG